MRSTARAARRGTKKQRLMLLLLVLFLAWFCWTMQRAVRSSPRPSSPPSTLAVYHPTYEPATINPLQALVQPRATFTLPPAPSGSFTFDVSVIVATRGEEDPVPLVKQLLSGGRTRIEVVMMHDKHLPQSSIGAIDAFAAKASVPLKRHLVGSTTRYPRRSTMLTEGAMHADSGAETLVFLAPYLELEPAFVETLLQDYRSLVASLPPSPLGHATPVGSGSKPSVGTLSCTTLVPASTASAGGGREVLQHGFDVREGNRGEIALARRRNGFSPRDSRVRSVEATIVGTCDCLLVAREQYRAMNGFGTFATLTDSALEELLDPAAPQRLMSRMGALYSSQERIMSSISIETIAMATAGLKTAVRAAYDTLMFASSVAEELRHELVRVHDDVYDASIAALPLEEKILHTTKELKHVANSLKELKEHSFPCDDELAWDLSAKLLSYGSVSYVSAATATIVTSRQLEVQRGLADMIRHRGGVNPFQMPSSVISPKLSSKWGELMRGHLPLRRSFSSSPLRVIWDAFCCGCCGFSNEIVHFVYPLEEHVKVNLIPSPACFCAGFPGAVSDTIARMQTTSDQFVVEHAADDEIVVWVSHTDPMSYNNPVFRKRRPDYVVGRSMYEFTRIDDEWVTNANTECDEIWVPAEWVRRVFVWSGVAPSKLTIVPEAVDTAFFDPSAQNKITLPPSAASGPASKWKHWCNKQAAPNAYKFYSNFKWEPRKGWDIMFEAYWRAFKPDDPVSLYVQTHIWFSGGPETYGDKHNTTFLRIEVENMFFDRLGVESLDDVPHFCFITEDMSEVAVAEMYNSVDAFVLPTRGEGWGLPAIQAMSMGLPTISTNWGGQMEFMKPHNSFLIDLDAVEELDDDSVYRWRRGKKWATPSMNSTARLMRLVYNSPDKARAVGRRARQYVVDYFSEAAVAALVKARLEEIRMHVIKTRIGQQV